MTTSAHAARTRATTRVEPSAVRALVDAAGGSSVMPAAGRQDTVELEPERAG
jgi:hypothetical protein